MLNVVINQPFLFVSYVPRYPRLILEGGVLVLFYTYFIYFRKKTPYILLSLFILLSVFSFFGEQSDLKYFIGSFNKIAFAIGFYFFIKYESNLLQKFTTILNCLIPVICGWIILAFFYSLVFPRSLNWIDFSKIDSNAAYYYKSNGLFQYFVTSRISFLPGRPIGFFFEPIHVGFISVLMIFFVLSQNLSKKKFSFLLLLIILMGGFSQSNGFILILIILSFFFILSKLKFRDKIWISILAILSTYFIITNFEINSIGSISNRLERIRSSWFLIRESSLYNLLFGNGTKKIFDYSNYAPSGAYTGILINNGIIFALLWCGYILNILKRNFFQLISLIGFFLLLNPLNYMIFYVIITLTYFNQKLSSTKGL